MYFSSEKSEMNYDVLKLTSRVYRLINKPLIFISKNKRSVYTLKP